MVAFVLMICISAQIWIATDTLEASRLIDLFIFMSLGTVAQEIFRMLTMKKEDLHIHHYYIGAMACALCWGQHKYTVFLAHLFLGVYVEGVAAWGRDPTFMASS